MARKHWYSVEIVYALQTFDVKCFVLAKGGEISCLTRISALVRGCITHATEQYSLHAHSPLG